MFKHSTSEVVMVRPAAFFFNAQTAVNNAYQNNDDLDLKTVQERAIKEFDNLVSELEKRGVKVNVLQDTVEPATPDSIFPNNWFSTHEGGTMVIYPMFAENRQLEISKFSTQVQEIAAKSFEKEDFFTVLDYSHNNVKGKIFEGTGSMVIDRKNKVAYCNLSPRAEKEMFLKFCEQTGHKPVFFTAEQDGVPVYHTNVIMGIGEKKAIICLDSIEAGKRDEVKAELEKGGNEIIDISLEQVRSFLGNTLELKGSNGKNFIAMSKTAYDSLTEEQKNKIEETTEILAADIPTIEFYGGGSVRCMIAEIF